jgi:hypothetical protein
MQWSEIAAIGEIAPEGVVCSTAAAETQTKDVTP